jgi:hypothetical protein
MHQEKNPHKKMRHKNTTTNQPTNQPTNTTRTHLQVNKNAVNTTPSRSEQFLAEEGLPRRLPSNVSALESSLRDVASAGNLSRFDADTEEASSVRSKQLVAQSRLNRVGAPPEEFHPTFYSTNRYFLKVALVGVYVLLLEWW